jgi:hypothetical protein
MGYLDRETRSRANLTISTDTQVNKLMFEGTRCGTNAPTSTAFIVVASTVPIIGPFGTFTTRVTDICDTIIIRGLIITAMATVIEVGSQLAKPPPRERAFAILRTRSELQGKELE